MRFSTVVKNLHPLPWHGNSAGSLLQHLTVLINQGFITRHHRLQCRRWEWATMPLKLSNDWSVHICTFLQGRAEFIFNIFLIPEVMKHWVDRFFQKVLEHKIPWIHTNLAYAFLRSFFKLSYNAKSYVLNMHNFYLSINHTSIKPGERENTAWFEGWKIWVCFLTLTG